MFWFSLIDQELLVVLGSSGLPPAVLQDCPDCLQCEADEQGRAACVLCRRHSQDQEVQ